MCVIFKKVYLQVSLPTISPQPYPAHPHPYRFRLLDRRDVWKIKEKHTEIDTRLKCNVRAVLFIEE